MDYLDRPDRLEYAPMFRAYVDRVPRGGLVDLLRRQVDDTVSLLRAIPEAESDRAYAPGKWTIAQVIGHVTDVERVFSYRALRFGRGDPAELPGIDENQYAAAGGFGARSMASLIEELLAVRQATVLLFDGMPADAWLRRGVASEHEVSVRALACIIAGHELHHRAILAERYLPLLGQTAG